jgi:hypothetical protein
MYVLNVARGALMKQGEVAADSVNGVQTVVAHGPKFPMWYPHSSAKLSLPHLAPLAAGF